MKGTAATATSNRSFSMSSVATGAKVAASVSSKFQQRSTSMVAKTARATSNRTAVSKPKPPPQTAPHSSSIRRSTKGVTAPPKKNARDSTAAAEAPTTKEQHVSSTPEAVQGRVKKQAADRILDTKEFKDVLYILKRKCMLPEEEIREKYLQFKKDCPSGFLSRSKFLDIIGGGVGPDAEEVVDGIFKVFDDDKSGKLDFVEYMMAVQSTQLRSPEEKLSWIFKMYDKDFSGSIETEELKQMFVTLFEMSSIEIDDTQMELLLKDVVQTLDADGNGEVDLEEFVDGSLKTPFLMNILCPEQEQEE